MDYQAIREATTNCLQRAGVPAHPHLPLLDERPRQTAEEVAKRIVALYCLAGLANGASGSSMLVWVDEERMRQFFQGEELAKLSRDLLEKDLNALSWCQESLYAAAWVLSLAEELTWPDEAADLKPLFPLIPPVVDVAFFVSSARLRSEPELVQAADLYYCLDASLRHDALWNNEPAESRYPMVQIVMERRRTLDWLMQDCAWGEVALDT